MAGKTATALQRWSDGGRLPVVIDASSCTHGVISELEVEGVEVLDSVAWVHDRLLERLQVSRRLGGCRGPSDVRMHAARPVGQARGDRRTRWLTRS